MNCRLLSGEPADVYLEAISRPPSQGLELRDLWTSPDAENAAWDALGDDERAGFEDAGWGREDLGEALARIWLAALRAGAAGVVVGARQLDPATMAAGLTAELEAYAFTVHENAHGERWQSLGWPAGYKVTFGMAGVRFVLAGGAGWPMVSVWDCVTPAYRAYLAATGWDSVSFNAAIARYSRHRARQRWNGRACDFPTLDLVRDLMPRLHRFKRKRGGRVTRWQRKGKP